MNLYILVEGKQTERILYPIWLQFIAPHMTRVQSLSSINENNYFLISGEGYPRMLDVKLNDSLKDIEQQGNFDLFWVVLDSDGESVPVRRQYVLSRIAQSGIDIGSCQVEVIIQDPCIETWGLGNSSMISVNHLYGELSDFYRHYDVKNNDPELMRKQRGFLGSEASFHERYLKSMLILKGIKYTKKNPQGMKDLYYFNALIERSLNQNNHLRSFAHFYQNASSL